MGVSSRFLGASFEFGRRMLKVVINHFGDSDVCFRIPLHLLDVIMLLPPGRLCALK